MHSLTRAVLLQLEASRRCILEDPHAARIAEDASLVDIEAQLIAQASMAGAINSGFEPLARFEPLAQRAPE